MSPSAVAVDGLALATAVPLSGLPAAPKGRPRWRLRVERGDPDGAPGRRSTTGTLRARDGTWARYGRDEAGPCLRARGAFDLRTRPAERLAVLRHARGRRDDALVVRRALPYLAALEGWLVLHAACVLFEGRAVVLCADARTGKSTLALALDREGLPVLADDHVVLSPSPGGGLLAHASVPWVEVAEVSARFVGARPTRRDAGDLVCRLRTPRPARPAPLAAVAFLRRGRRVAVRAVRAATALPRLLRRYAFVGDPSDGREHARRFSAACEAVSTAAVLSVTVPDGLGELVGRVAVIPALIAPRLSGG